MSFKLENTVTFYPSARYASGTNIATLNGERASSTNCCQVAAVAAAWKHFNKLLNLAHEKAEDFNVTVVEPLVGGTLYKVTFTRKEAI